MARPAQDVTEAELSVLRALWDRPGATIRDLAEALYPAGGASGYATVQKLLERLEAKGFAARERESPAHRFRAAVDRDALIGQRLRAVAESLCDGSLVPLLSHLVRSSDRLPESERRALRALVESLEARPPRLRRS
jgi:BlaI family penicillinase repressor